MSDVIKATLERLAALEKRVARGEKMEFATGASLRTAGSVRFQRVLPADFSLSDGEFLLVVSYINLNGHDFTMPDDGDCEVVFL